jgi:hypothetical protein
MKLATGTVVDGRVVVEGEPFAEGEKVTILGHEAGAPFRLSAEQKKELLESMAEADRGEFVDFDELMAELDESN